ncbi:MAG: DUF6644 family protein [Vicinamibacterales bacterium]
MSLLAYCEWLAATQGSIALHESMYMYPIVESTHVLALMLFVGFATVLDLRLLGLILKGVPVSQVAGRLLPWAIAGFIIMIFTGALLFYAIPVRTYQSIFFRAKVVFLVLAGLNVWYFHTRVFKRIAEWDREVITPKAARRAGLASLVLWAGIIVAGRMIAYNWFDCDIQPQSAFVNWAAGCVVPPPTP